MFGNFRNVSTRDPGAASRRMSGFFERLDRRLNPDLYQSAPANPAPPHTAAPKVIVGIGTWPHAQYNPMSHGRQGLYEGGWHGQQMQQMQAHPSQWTLQMVSQRTSSASPTIDTYPYSHLYNSHPSEAAAHHALPAGPLRLTPANQRMPAQPLSSTHPLSSNIGERIEVIGHEKANAQPYTVPRDGWFWRLTVQQKGDFTKPGMVTYVHVA